MMGFLGWLIAAIIAVMLCVYGIMWAVKPFEHLSPCEHFTLGALPERTTGYITYRGKHILCVNGEALPTKGSSF